MFGGGGAGMNPWIVEKTQCLRVLLGVSLCLHLLQNLSYGGERFPQLNKKAHKFMVKCQLESDVSMDTCATQR